MPITSYVPSSAISRAGVCTSSTRPASPYEGQVIYETDTDKILAWTGSAWYAPWNMAWGSLGGAYRLSGNVTATTTTGDITGMSVTFTAVAGRRYKATWTATGEKQISTGWTGVYLANSANTIFTSVYSTASAGGYVNLSGTTFFDNIPAGSYTMKLRVQCVSDTTLILASGQNPCILLVEDVGPV
jgi:hypothetical protein